MEVNWEMGVRKWQSGRKWELAGGIGVMWVSGRKWELAREMLVSRGNGGQYEEMGVSVDNKG